MKSLVAFIFLILSSQVYAQEKTFEREYTYKASEMDSKVSCRAIAISQLRSTLLNELGVYVESESLLTTADVNGQFTQNFAENIATISAGIVKFQVLLETWNGENFWMKAAITIDEKSLSESLKMLAKDKQKLKELFEVKEQLKNANIELSRLRVELFSKSTMPDKRTIENSNREYGAGVKSLTAVEFYFKAEERFKDKSFVESIEYYDRALSFDPEFAMAYLGKGLARVQLRQYQAAIDDYNSAIKASPMLAGAYYCRGIAKYQLEDLKGAIKDYSRAAEIDPTFAGAYVSIGNARIELTDNDGAIKAYDKAIELDPRFVDAYWGRAAAKGNQQKLREAMEDSNQAIKLDPKCAGAFLTRGLIKAQQKDHRGAIDDYDKAIDFEPGNSKAYYGRGLSRMILGQKDSGCLDLSKAGELGVKAAYELIGKYCN